MCCRGWLRTILTFKINSTGRPGKRRIFWPLITASHLQAAKFKFHSRDDVGVDESWGTGAISAKYSWWAGLVLIFWPVITASHIEDAKFKFNSRDDVVIDESWDKGAISAKCSWCAGLVLA